MHLPLRYTQALITQMAQTAVCNRHHSVDQRLCGWLLLSLDRLGSNELSMTRELIANMLGVRREGVQAGYNIFAFPEPLDALLFFTGRQGLEFEVQRRGVQRPKDTVMTTHRVVAKPLWSTP